MKINGRGQAKILSPEVLEHLWSKGFLCSRDRALYQLCYYLACRCGEARQLFYSDVFDSLGNVKEIIVISKEITKGKQATRSISTSPKLAVTLKQYQQESQELLSIYQQIGRWDYQSLDCPSIIAEDGSICCPQCQSQNLTTAGYSRGKKILKCRDCGYRFQQKTAFLEFPELKQRVLELGVFNSSSYGFLFQDSNHPYLFPGFGGKGYISSTAAQEAFTKAVQRLGIIGASTHSFRRTALTTMHKNGVPLRVIQRISGHVSLKNLQLYLEVTPDEIIDAINKLP